MLQHGFGKSAAGIQAGSVCKGKGIHVKRVKAVRSFFRKYGSAYLFIAPFFILFFIFQLFPMVWSAVLSFHSWDGLGQQKFVGWQNYQMILRDSVFITGFKNTFFYWVFGLTVTLVLSMGLALLLNVQGLKGRGVFKSLTFLPYVCASVAMGLIFNMLFDYNAGLINECIKLLGGAPVKWLTSTELSCIPPLVLYVFRSVPWYTNIIYSSLLNIPAELYEAATVDGAGPVVKFFQITIPSLGNILVFCMLTLTVSAWQIFTEPYLMPGPASSNISISQYLYNSAFSMFKMGYASAIGYILTMILLVFSLIQFRLMKRTGEA